MSFPTVAGFGGSNSGANVTTTTVDLTLAGAASVGDLLIVIIVNDGGGNLTWPAGWTILANQGSSAVSAPSRSHIVQSGDPTSIDVTHTSEGTAYQVYRIAAGTFHITNISFGGGETGTTNAPSPLALNPPWPSGWDTLWIAIAGNDNGTVSISSAPANYTDLQNDRWNNAADGVGVASARRFLAADSEDPGTFSMSAAEDWVSESNAIPGIAGFPNAALSGANSGGNVTTSSVDVTIAGTPVAGDLIIIGICKDGTGAFTWPATPAFTQTPNFPITADAGSAQAVLDCRYRIWQAGDSTTVSITHANESTGWEVVRIADGSFDAATAPAAATTAPGASTNPDPPNLDPAGWATEKTLWLALAGNDGNVAITAGPSGYFYFRNDRVAAASGAGIAVAWLESEAASEDPGVFTMGSEQWAAGTIAIRPAAAVEAVRPSVYNVSQAVHRSFSY